MVITAFVGTSLILACVAENNFEIKQKYEALLEKAESGDAQAQYEISELIFSINTTDPPIPDDAKLALAWLQKSANQGNVQALCRLGRRYQEADGVTVDPEKSL